MQPLLSQLERYILVVAVAATACGALVHVVLDAFMHMPTLLFGVATFEVWCRRRVAITRFFLDFAYLHGWALVVFCIVRP